MGQQTFVDGQVLTGAEMMNMPQGLLGATQNSSAQVISTTTTPGTAITGMSIAVTLASNRNIRLRAVMNGQFSSASGIGAVAIYEGATKLGQANFGAGSVNGEDVGVLEVILATSLLGTSPTAGTHTYTVNCWCTVGTMTLISGVYSTFTCEDV